MQSIFVSSTFRDMHYERDIIQTKVVPAINAVAAEYGESITAFDLRWGVNTTDMSEESSAKKVLSVCLNEIDRCRPYMIVILGYRYGWIPDSKMLTEAIQGKNNFSLSEENISVTALEIEYGALSDSADIERTLFYFREIEGSCESIYLSEDEEHRKKLEDLKKRIQSIHGSHVKTYYVQYGEKIEESMDFFAKMVTEDICGLMQSEWEKNAQLDEYDLDQIKHKDYLSEKASQFIARDVLLNQCMEIFQKHNKLLLKGISGCGKSTLISKIGYELQAKGHHVIPIYCGYTKLCSSGFDILRYIVWELEKELGIIMHFCNTATEKIATPSAWYEYYDFLIKRCNENISKKITFLIDGIDQLIQDDIAQEFTYLPGSDSTTIQFILSTLPSESLPVGYPCIEVGILSLEERKLVIQGILSTKHRELSEPVINKMSIQKNADLPLYLNLMVQRLLMMNFSDYSMINELGGGMEAISNYQITLIDKCPITLDWLSAHVMTHAMSLVSGSSMKDTVRLIAVSRHGLRLSDLEGIFKSKIQEWNVVDAVSFFQYLGTLFIYRKDGRIDFAHKSIRTGILTQCTAEEIQQIHIELCHWLYNLPQNDEIRAQEVVWHMIQADRKREFANVVAELSSNKQNLSGMVKDIVDTVVSDDACWFIEVIKECFLDVSFPEFSNMVNLYLFFGIIDTVHNLQIKLKISEIMLEAAQKRCSVYETRGNIWDISVACDRLSNVHMIFDTKDHRALALKCSQHSLNVRQKLLDMYNQLDTVQKQREYLTRESQNTNLHISRTPDDSELQIILEILINDVKRGICVACEDIAHILSNEDGDHKQEILDYLSKSLRLRLDMYCDGEKTSYTTAYKDEAAEISILYGKIADLHMAFDDDEHWIIAENNCVNSLNIVENSLNKEKTETRLEAWCAANIRMAELFLHKTEKEYRKKALAFYMHCVSVLEKINTQQRTVYTQRNLADIYNRLGNYYDKMEDDDSKIAAEVYYQKSRELVLEISQKCPSIENIRNVVIITQNHTEHIINNKNSENKGKEKTKEMADAITAAYQKAKHLFEESRTKESCNLLNEIYDTGIHMIKMDDTGNNMNERIIVELKVCKLENLLEVTELTIDDVRDIIIRYAELGSEVESLNDCKEVSLSESLKLIFEKIEFPSERLTIVSRRRAYELLKVSFRLAEFLQSKSNSLTDLDIYAVTLSKYSSMCMQVSPEEWEDTNNKLLKIAHFLYRNTNNQKYMQMLAMGEMGRMILSKNNFPDSSTSDSPDNGIHSADTELDTAKTIESKRASQLKKQISELEDELKQTSGIKNIVKRKKLEKQIDLLKRELQKVLL